MKKVIFHTNEGKSEKSEANGMYTPFFETSESDSFTEREDINEFLRDGALINVLYDQTLDLLYKNGESADSEKQSLRVLNNAYKICWMMTHEKMTYGEITDKMYFPKGDYLVRDLSYYVAWSILKVYKEFYVFDEMTFDIICDRTLHKDLFTSYQELVRMQDDPCVPICFSTPGVRVFPSRPFLESFVKSTYTDTFTDKLKRILHNYCIHTGPIGSADDEEEQVDRLAHAMIEMEDNHKTTIESKDSTIARLRAEISSLKQQLVEKETKVEVKEVVKKVIVKEPEPMTKILNWDSITDYALGLGNFKEVQVVYTMLNRISSRGRYFDDGLEQNLQKLEAYIRDLQKPIINQTNSGCQQFYGNINDSQFNTPNE